MHQLKTTADNVGGVARIVAIPTSDFRSLSRNFITRRISLTLKSTANCIDIQCNRNEEVTDEQNTSDDGISYLHQLTGKIFSLDIEREQYLYTLANGSWLLLVTSSNGISKLYGSVEVPLRFSYKRTDGQHKSTPAGVSYTFASSQPAPAIYIDSHPL